MTHHLEALDSWLAETHPNLCFAKLEFPARCGTLALVAGLSPRGDHKHVALARVAGSADGADDGARLGVNLEVVHDPYPDAMVPYLRSTNTQKG